MKNRYSLPLLAGLLALLAAHPALAQDGYGTGTILNVPQATGTITLDGNADEADWAMAPEVNLTANWADYGGVAEPDIAATGKVLWKDGVLYVYATYQDYKPFFFGGDNGPDKGAHLLVGVDLLRQDDSMPDPGFSGWVDNMPDGGPVAYKITGAYGPGSEGITANFGLGDDPVSPVDSNWVDGYVFLDDTNLIWGVEMAIYGTQVQQGAMLGFNIGGAAGSQEYADGDGDGDGTYSYYGWQVCDPVPPGEGRTCFYEGGAVMSDAGSFATLVLQTVVANEGGPNDSGFALRSTGPNPFRGSTALGYDMARAGTVDLAVFDALGRRVATLDEGTRAAGSHPVRFDGSALPAGVYLARLSVDGAAVATRRLALTR